MNLSIKDCEKIAERVEKRLEPIQTAAKSLEIEAPDTESETYIHQTVESRREVNLGRHGRHETVRRRPHRRAYAE